MSGEKETVIMWAEYGDALFWHRAAGCCGDSMSLVTGSGRVVDLSGVSGLQEWYARFDNAGRPAFQWSAEEFETWRNEGFCYARAVRDLLPDEIDLEYVCGDGKVSTLIHRKNRMIPSKPLVSDTRLKKEVLDQFRCYPDVETEPYTRCVELLVSDCKHEELLENAHACFSVSEEREDLKIIWHQSQFCCELSFGRKNGSSDYWMQYWFDQKHNSGAEESPIVPQYSYYLSTIADKGNFAGLAETLAWLILERGLK